MFIEKNGVQLIIPPFTQESATAKVQLAEDGWNSKDPQRVAKAYSVDCDWRNRDEFFQGREAIVDFLTRKWQHESHYKLMKELWAYQDNRISVRFEYEWLDLESNQWMRTHGNEHWEFNSAGIMTRRDMSANDVMVDESELRYVRR